MSDKPMSESRRDAVKLMLGAAVAIPVINLIGVGTARAGAPAVTADDPTAVALKYSADASKADRAGAARPGLPPAEQFCSNCQFSGASDVADHLTCTLFPGKVVSAKGWCTSWTKKA